MRPGDLVTPAGPAVRECFHNHAEDVIGSATLDPAAYWIVDVVHPCLVIAVHGSVALVFNPIAGLGWVQDDCFWRRA